VPAFSITSSPRQGRAKAKRSLATVTASVTSMTRCGPGGVGRSAAKSASTAPQARRKASAVSIATSALARRQCWPHSTSTAVFVASAREKPP
jgi:hypothetical protein